MVQTMPLNITTARKARTIESNIKSVSFMANPIYGSHDDTDHGVHCKKKECGNHGGSDEEFDWYRMVHYCLMQRQS
jgi:hypothetical protein